ncbi:MAG: purine-nucleoside phosphorylase [Saprospiraceae bacterium]|nr:purine-nucleoside phosphorylase [Saprospiraceae bacterium]
MAPLDLFDRIQETAAFLHDRGVGAVDVGVILGSGMSAVADMLEDPLIIPYDEIPHWGVTSVTGHRGELRYGRIGQSHVLMCAGRLHYYEGYPMWQVAYAMRVMKALSAAMVVTTGAAGGLNPDYTPGDVVLLHDHVSLMPDNPLRGPHDPRLGVRFPDMSRPYDVGLRHRILSHATALAFEVREGVYAGVAGPNLETSAEYFFLRKSGADMVGMSIIPDAIVAVQSGLRLLGMCVISNDCSNPLQTGQTTVEEVIRVVEAATDKVAQFVRLLCDAPRRA